MKIIYIMGAGHSGSTILDIVLGNAPNVESVGELYKLHRSGWILNDSRRCSCGLPIHECSYWTSVRSAWSEITGHDDIKGYIDLQRQFELRVWSWARLLLNSRKPSPEFVSYLNQTAALYKAIQIVSGNSIVVDSSKVPRRAYALSLHPDIDLKLIHLVRDGRACIWSRLKPRSKDIESGTPRDFPGDSPLHTTRCWLSTNLQCERVVKHETRNSVIRIRYEDFMTDTEAVLSRIGQVCGIEVDNLIQKVRSNVPLVIGHKAGGNSMRMAKTTTIRADFSWISQLPETDQRLFWRLAGWKARRYQYSRNLRGD